MSASGTSEGGGAISRRGFLGVASSLAAGAALRAGRHARAPDSREPDALAARVPFYGRHQAGVTTPAQRCSSFAAFDLRTDRRDELVALLRRWTAVAANLCAGRPAEPLSERPDGVEEDSGAALGLGPARLTINFGFGPTLFGVGGPDRLGLRERWPMALVAAPAYPGDRLDPAQTGGELTVHACADDPQVAFHATRQLARAAGASASIRWAQAGFNEADVSQGTPRDLLGFRDGTVNPTTEDELALFVWVGAGQDQPWMQGGTYLVVRRIRILLDRWDAETLAAQERVIGRHKISGAPLGRTSEHDPLDLEARGSDGRLLIPPDAHVRLASPQANWDQMLLRRNYAYDNGVSALPGEPAGPGTLDAGLFFCAYQQNPRLAFIPMFAKMAVHDALRHFTVHTASAVVALPPGVAGPGHFIGEQLFD